MNVSAGSITGPFYFGSDQVLSLTTSDAITIEAPGCLAAPLVNVVAKQAINLGLKGQADWPEPVRIFASILTMTTQHLSIGAVSFPTEPTTSMIYCEKLTLSKPAGQEDPEYFEIVKSWAINDSMEIENTTI